MAIKIGKWKEVGDCVILYSDSYLNGLEGERLEEDCSELLKMGLRKIVIDFTRTELINSIGVSILISIIEMVREGNGVLLFSGLKRVNIDTFNMLGLTKYVPVFETEEEALLKIQNSRFDPESCPEIP